MASSNSFPIRAVFFDLDDTLRVNVPHPQDAFTEFVASQGISITQQDRDDAFRWGHAYWANSTTLLDDYEQHQGYEDPFWQNYTRRHLRSLNLDEDTIEALAPEVHSFMRRTYRPESRLVPHTFDVLARLRDAGLYVGMLTNRTRTVYREMLDLGLDWALDLFLTGGQVGAFKPSAQFFQPALELMQLAPSEVAYVGDNFYADIQGAQSAGLLPVLIDPRDLYPQWTGARIQQLDQLFDALPVQA